MKAEGAKIYKKDYKQVLNRAIEERKQFDIIYLDPPYKEKYIDNILQIINEHQLIKPGGWVVVEMEKESELEDSYNNLTLQKTVIYGISKIFYFRG